MKFIKFNYNNNTSFTFSLDFVTTFKSHTDGTEIVLIDGRVEILPIHEDDLIVQIFSDNPDNKEYELIEIDQPEGDRVGVEDIGKTIV